eukprot:TRINITY_DN1079_c0_g1_i1.p2 TRINITY_DN1079_c0_g1~~TRINITY_DN1079_c0_g1_i1.p2  ORF type:complete len:133 (+),score=13.64 TRINITY_DN1079_c0_g1_i1:285-683(+)
MQKRASMKKAIIITKEQMQSVSQDKCFSSASLFVFFDELKLFLSVTCAYTKHRINNMSIMKKNIAILCMIYFSHVLCVDTCLLYTSDAADDTPCVDLGGRRNIKKKTKKNKSTENTDNNEQQRTSRAEETNI